MLETGIIEEIMMENYYRNPDKNYSIWDGILYEIVRYEPNIDLILNCSVNALEMDDGRIASVVGWQLTTQENHIVHAKYFADCSGDSVLAPLCGAEYRVGREAKKEFGETFGPDESDRKTMGMSCMVQAREEDRPSEFIAPKWSYKYTKEDLPHRIPHMENPYENFWYLELGGEYDSIHDTETLRDELLKVAYGIWDFVKNDPENKERYANWRLDWMLTFLASYAQEESRSVSENCTWRIRDRFSRGEPIWFRIYGYRMQNGRLEIHPEEAEVVRMIFSLYLNGFGCQAIANRLQSMGIPSVGGTVWHHTMIAYVITNEHYCGNLLLQKTFVTDHLTKRKRINRGELERIHVKGTHEAIIDPDTFWKVQEIYKMRREHYCSKTHAAEPYLFTGVLKCANCGASYRRKVNHRGTSYEKVIWVCATYTMRGKAACPSKAVPDEVLMRKTAEVLEADGVDREMLLDAVERIEVGGDNRLTYVF